ncbi:YjjI family glycine radical enzyme [Photobacterium leiognathi subsp. mandapamensis]|uniref:YjjI family glycine radical enzyme n=1 Tax=Photobacterium leiognathi TaxID=553611 RepID=UPI000D164435|nr:YjjI family glycine radical enzyme [Photobacterium leiognathi]PSW66357.1 YjjI family glycine radical enzyme [Photobacterium leiognathi subsp. mandapamensis]
MSSQSKIKQIITSPTLSPKQKTLFLSLEAEAIVDYMSVSDEILLAKNEGVICDMFEGNAPFKPRYVLPDYAKYLQQGSAYLELEPARDLGDALNALTIIYHHVPSVTNHPVYIGQLDNLLLPFVNNEDEASIYKKLRNFWIMLDRTLPDAFMHANIGPTDNIICRTILKIDAELKQVAPNLTFMYDAEITPASLLEQACKNICECSKPHIANYPMFKDTFGEQGFGIVSCYNSLPLAGGANTLVRLNLKEAAKKALDADDFLTQVLPHYCQLTFGLIDARSAFLHEESNFFNSFLVQEGLIEEARFAPMFGIYGMAEAVNLLLEKSGSTEQYGHSDEANNLALAITELLSDIVTNTPVKYGYKQRALLHSQGGISCDQDVTPGIRIPYGSEPDPVIHVKALAAHHKYYLSGISDILTIDETVKQNPQAMVALCQGALSMGFREFTANVHSNDLVRVTGYMVKLSDVAKFKQQGSRTNTTWLGSEASEQTAILQRLPRVLSHEQMPKFEQLVGNK